MKETLLDNITYFEENGYLPPQNFITNEKAKYYKNRFFESIDQKESNSQKTDKNLDAYHFRFPWALELATESLILDQVSQVLKSDDILLWAMHFWYKEPNSGKIIPWHQDAFYWDMEPQINATAWIALDHCFEENGCLKIIPGTHKSKYTHEKVENIENSFGSEVNLKLLNDYEIKSMIMTPGEFVVFNENTLHGSQKNTSKVPRIACSCRYTTPNVKFNFKRDDPRIKIKVVKGEDNYQQNEHFKF